MIRGAIAVAAITCCASAAQAGVVYNWLQASPSPTGGVASGRLELRADAWASGSVVYALAGDGAAITGIPSSALRCPARSFSCTDPDSPILDFGMSFRNGLTGAFGGAAGFGSSISRYDSGAFRLSTASGLLSGSIVVHNIGEDLFLSGNPPWAVDFATDFQGACNDSACRGITGLWVLDVTTVPGFVSEPGIASLLALGAIGLTASLRPARQTRSALVHR